MSGRTKARSVGRVGVLVVAHELATRARSGLREVRRRRRVDEAVALDVALALVVVALALVVVALALVVLGADGRGRLDVLIGLAESMALDVALALVVVALALVVVPLPW